MEDQNTSNTFVIKGKFRDLTLPLDGSSLHQALKFMESYGSLWDIEKKSILDILNTGENLAFKDVVKAFNEIQNDRDEIEANIYKFFKKSMREKDDLTETTSEPENIPQEPSIPTE